MCITSFEACWIYMQKYKPLIIIRFNVTIFYLEYYITFLPRRHLVTDCLHILQTFMPSAYIIYIKQSINSSLHAAVDTSSGYGTGLKAEVTSRCFIQNSCIYIVFRTRY
jgi:hypothetical protein